MPQAERYEPTGELHAFDGGEDDDAPEEEGSRLALLLVLALFVLGAFGGVVYLAYNQGVKQGRDEAPRQVVQSTQLPQKVGAASVPRSAAPETKAPSDDGLPNDTAPPLPTAIPQVPKAAPQAHVLAQSVAPKLKPATTAPHPKIAAPPPAANRPAAAQTLARMTALSSKPQTHDTSITPAGTAPDTTHTPKAIVPAAPPPTQTELTQTVPPERRVATVTTSPSTPLGKPAVAATTPGDGGASTAPTPSTTPAPAKSAGGFVLQIGAYKSEAEAMASWRAYKSAHAAVATFEPDIREVQLPGKGTWYRLRIGSFASIADANTLCARLKSGGANCFPAKR